MPDSSIPIATAPATPQTTPNVILKMFSVAGADGSVQQVQPLISVDEFGDAVDRPLTEATGMRILNVLVQIHNLLCDAHGTGFPINAMGAPGAKE